GRAELDAYDLVNPRYGELREGTAVLVYVTETFTRAQRVKTDGGHQDEYPVIKLNDVRDFPTGIYDYNVMTSTFVPLDGHLPLGLPTKVSLSVQEWCGHVYDQLIVDPGQLQRVRHSYFDGEADGSWVEAIPEGAVFGDALPLLVRGLAGTLVEPGETRTVPYLPTLLDTRLAHQPLVWQEVTLSRSAGPRMVQVPVGPVEVFTITSRVTDGPETTWDVEVAPPHRLMGWSRSTGEVAVLRGTLRNDYWNHNDPAGKELLSEMGFAPSGD
ncbi:MAG: hypothetical protein JRJ84_02720, partial [Deltaproteobacteria bacterium]|nr:hypothetical protein [Deltaproteobacteria bacterium]